MTVEVLTRERRSELLATTDRDRLVELAERCLAEVGDPVLVHPPEVGMVMLTVREPVEAVRFHLGEVLVTRCEVEHLGHRGWSMRMGDDPLAALAAAVLDAEVEAGGRHRPDVEHLCEDTANRTEQERRREWAEIEPTIVSFEEMD